MRYGLHIELSDTVIEQTETHTRCSSWHNIHKNCKSLEEADEICYKILSTFSKGFGRDEYVSFNQERRSFYTFREGGSIVGVANCRVTTLN